MPKALFEDNAVGRLASGISPADLSIELVAGDGVRFPPITGTDWFWSTLVDASNNLEQVKVTARSTDILTVVRAQNGTTARTYLANDLIELRLNQAYIDALVQRDATETLTNKTLQAPVIAGVPVIEMIEAEGDLLAGSVDNTPVRVPVGADGTALIADASVAGGMAWKTLAAEIGQCYFQYVSASSVRLDRHNGRHLFINGKWETIPQAGVTLDNGGLVASTVYNIYAFMSGATMTLEASTTPRATDATYGHQIKAADPTRTLVGKVWMNASSQFVDSSFARTVISWFNRRPKSLQGNIFGGDVISGTAQWFSLSATNVLSLLSWGEDSMSVTGLITARSVTVGAQIFCGIGLDSSAAPTGTAGFGQVTSINVPMPIASNVSGAMAEGVRSIYLLAGTSSGLTTYLDGYCGISTNVMG